VRGKRTREVTGRRRVESIEGDGSSKLKMERYRGVEAMGPTLFS
jgi:hypothetical protein